MAACGCVVSLRDYVFIIEFPVVLDIFGCGARHRGLSSVLFRIFAAPRWGCRAQVGRTADMRPLPSKRDRAYKRGCMPTLADLKPRLSGLRLGEYI